MVDYLIEHAGRHYLVDGATDLTVFSSRHRWAVRVVAFLLRRSAFDVGSTA